MDLKLVSSNSVALKCNSIFPSHGELLSGGHLSQSNGSSAKQIHYLDSGRRTDLLLNGKPCTSHNLIWLIWLLMILSGRLCTPVLAHVPRRVLFLPARWRPFHYSQEHNCFIAEEAARWKMALQPLLQRLQLASTFYITHGGFCLFSPFFFFPISPPPPPLSFVTTVTPKEKVYLWYHLSPSLPRIDHK